MAPEPLLYDFGYRGATVADLLKHAERLDAIVVDVRFSPWGRGDFQQGRLQALLGDRYYWAKGLGNPAYREAVAEMHLHAPEQDLPRVEAWLRDGQAVILLCVCRYYAECHRQLVCRLLKQRMGVDVTHLREPNGKQVELF